MWYVQPANAQISLRMRAVWRNLIRAFASRLNILLTEHHLKFLSLE